jgi:glutamine synthetase adenylyltransferase
MSLPTVSERLVERFEARALEQFGEDAWRAGVREIMSAVNDEARHGKAGTVRDPNAVFVYRMTHRFRELREWRSSREKRTLTERERYADLYVALFDQAVQQRPTPISLARALQVLRSSYPSLNSRLIEKLSALGDSWPSPLLTPAGKPEMPKRSRNRSAKEDRHAGAVTARA